MKGNIFSIEEFSVFDGPGIRTTVFLKGCPLRCSWCHNPEGQNIYKEIVRSPNGCTKCNNCINNSTQRDGQIIFTQSSIKNCPKGLLRICGENTESSDLCEKILKNKLLLKDGGVTFSGGEPFMQNKFLFECLTSLKGKIHTAIQTSGYCNPEIFKKSLDITDYYLFDLKLAEENSHIKFTGVTNKNILRNLKILAASKKDFVIRIPLIPTVTDTAENVLGIIDILKENGVKYVELLPYNKMAAAKYKMLARQYSPDFNEKTEVQIPEKILIENNIDFKVL